MEKIFAKEEGKERINQFFQLECKFMEKWKKCTKKSSVDECEMKSIEVCNLTA